MSSTPLRHFLTLAAGAALAGCAASSVRLGEQALRDGRPEEALSRFEAAVAGDESVASATRGRGEAHLALGQPEEAVSDLEAARRMAPGDPRVLHLLARAYEAAGNTASAMDAYRDYGLVTDEREVKRLVRRKWADLRRDQVARDAARIQNLLRAGTFEPEPNSLAVYSFVPADSSSREDQELCRALTVFVSDDLAQVSALRLIAADVVDAIYSYLDTTYEERQFFDTSTMVVPGNLFPARHMIRGLYAHTPDGRIVIGVENMDAVSRIQDEPLTADGKLDDFFRVQADVVFRLLESLNIPVTPHEEQLILQRPTRDFTALASFGRGLYLEEHGDLLGARDEYRYAAALDEGFALASRAVDLVDSELAGEPVGAVPPPRERHAAADRAQRSSAQLGLGLIPDERGDATSVTTENNTAAHGTVTVSVVGTIGGN